MERGGVARFCCPSRLSNLNRIYKVVGCRVFFYRVLGTIREAGLREGRWHEAFCETRICKMHFICEEYTCLLCGICEKPQRSLPLETEGFGQHPHARLVNRGFIIAVLAIEETNY